MLMAIFLSLQVELTFKMNLSFQLFKATTVYVALVPPSETAHLSSFLNPLKELKMCENLYHYFQEKLFLCLGLCCWKKNCPM